MVVPVWEPLIKISNSRVSPEWLQNLTILSILPARPPRSSVAAQVHLVLRQVNHSIDLCEAIQWRLKYTRDNKSSVSPLLLPQVPCASSSLQTSTTAPRGAIKIHNLVRALAVKTEISFPQFTYPGTVKLKRHRSEESDAAK
jgi:hypothetical protein